MELYIKRKGVIVTEICEQYLLAACKEAREYCPYITEINETSAYIWNCMSSEKGVSSKQLLQAVLKEYEIDDLALAEQTIQEFLDEMIRCGYVFIAEGES